VTILRFAPSPFDPPMPQPICVGFIGLHSLSMYTQGRSSHLPIPTRRFSCLVRQVYSQLPPRPPIHPLYTPYTPPIHPLYTPYTLPIHPLHTPYTLPIHPLYTLYTPPIHPSYTPYTPPIYPLYTPDTPPIHPLDTPYTLPIHPLYTPYTPPIHPLYIPTLTASSSPPPSTASNFNTGDYVRWGQGLTLVHFSAQYLSIDNLTMHYGP